MKKKILLGSIIPSLMVLGSCSNVKLNTVQEKEDFFLQEDNLAHEELFGDVETLFKENAYNVAPSPLTTGDPIIGVQHMAYNDGSADVHAIRFIAVIDSDKTPSEAGAHWTREAFNFSDGSRLIAPNDAEHCNSTVAYTSLLDGEGNRYNISAFPGYDYFIVYTMLGIPDSYSNCFLNAYLSFDGVTSKEVVTTVDETYQFSYEQGKTGYFLAGKIGGNDNETLDEDNYKRGRNPENAYDNQATFSSPLEENDEFLIVHRGSSLLKVWGANALSYVGNTEIMTYFAASGTYIKAKSNNDYILYLNNSNQLWCSRYATYRIDLSGYSSLGDSNSLFVYSWGGGESAEAFQIDKNATSIKIGAGKTEFEFVKMPSDTTAETFAWGNKISESSHVATYAQDGYFRLFAGYEKLVYSASTFDWTYPSASATSVTINWGYDGSNDLYIVGSMNDWGLSNTYKMTKLGENSYSITLNLVPQEYTFKVVWAVGNDINNGIDWDGSNGKFGNFNRHIV